MKDILLISDDVAGEKMAGPGIRAWEISKCLSRHFQVTLAIPDYSYRSRDDAFFRDLPFGHFFYSVKDPSSIDQACREHKIVITQGYILSKFPSIKTTPAYLVCDLYVPFPLENLFVHKWKIPNLKDRETIHRSDLRVFNDQILHGDHFLCACDRQRDLFLGALLSLNRINPQILDLSPTLDELITIIPFGITMEDEPRPQDRIIRERYPRIQEDDILFFWGGVITNWYDPETLLKAFKAALKENPKIKLFFIAKKHPNPLLPEFDMANEAVRIADQLDLIDKTVFFNEEWIPYKEKGRYFTDADVGISIHKTHFETYFSFRIRLLDYLKYQLPIICTKGDYFADLVEKENLGITVESEDTGDLIRAFLTMSKDRDKRLTIQNRLEIVKKRFEWDRVTLPLIDHCRRVLEGQVHRKTLPTAQETAFVCSSSPDSKSRLFLKKHLWVLAQKIPPKLKARIKRFFKF